MRDRQPKRMAKQRGDREPIGDRADHRGLGEGAHKAQPGIAPLKENCDDEYQRDEHQQAGGKGFHAVEIGLPLSVA